MSSPSPSSSRRTVALAAVALGLFGLCSSLARARKRRTTAATPPSLSCSLSVTSESKTIAAATAASSSSVILPSAPSSAPLWTAAFPSCRFKPSFWTKLDSIRQAGTDHFVSIVDFDWTLSGYKNAAGTTCKTSYGVLTSSPLVSQAHRDASAEIKNKYYPYERDYTLTLQQRSALMVKWWNEIHVNMIQYGWTRSMVHDAIKLAVDNNDVFLRQGSVEFLQTLHRASIPLMVMSAGLHQTVEETLRLRNVFFDNTEVCANVMTFTNDDKLDSFMPLLPIHSSSKSFYSVSGDSKFRAVAQQRADAAHNRAVNVLVVGDTVGDVDMSNGLTADQRLNIGFVNADIEKRTADFLEDGKYDAIILNDGNWDLVMAVLRTIGINA